MAHLLNYSKFPQLGTMTKLWPIGTAGQSFHGIKQTCQPSQLTSAFGTTSASLLIVLLVGTVVGATTGLALGDALNADLLAILAGFLGAILAAVVRNLVMVRGVGVGPDNSRTPGGLRRSG